MVYDMNFETHESSRASFWVDNVLPRAGQESPPSHNVGMTADAASLSYHPSPAVVASSKATYSGAYKAAAAAAYSGTNGGCGLTESRGGVHAYHYHNGGMNGPASLRSLPPYPNPPNPGNGANGSGRYVPTYKSPWIVRVRETLFIITGSTQNH